MQDMMSTSALEALTHMGHRWWVLTIQGVIAIVFGVLAWAWPGITLYTLLLMFAAYSLGDGVFAIAASVRGMVGPGSWFWHLIHGLVSIGAAIVIVAWPGLSAITVIYFIGAWALVNGVFTIISAVQFRKEIANEWWLGLSGLAGIVFGVITFAHPGAGALAQVWLIGTFAIFAGITLILFSFRVRSFHHELGTKADTIPSSGGAAA